MKLKAMTYIDDIHQISVDILTAPIKGVCKVAYGRRLFDRHVDKLTPSNDETALFIGKQQQHTTN